MRAWSSIQSLNSHSCGDSQAEHEENEEMEYAQEENQADQIADLDGLDMMNQNEMDAEMDMALNAGTEF